MVFARRFLVCFVMVLLHPVTSLAEPLTNRSEPTSYCPGPCSAQSLVLLPQFELNLERCDAGDAEACFDVATMRMGKPYCCVPDLPIDRVWALKTMKKACDLGHDEACWQFYVLLTPWLDNLAKDNAKRGCEAGLGYACYVLGSWPLAPDGDPDLIRKACTLGDPNGCALAYADVACGADSLPGVTPQDAREKLRYSCSAYLSSKWERLRAKDMGHMVEDYGCGFLAVGLKMRWGGPTDWKKSRWLDHYLCRETGRCACVFPLATIGGVAMAGEASTLAIGLFVWRWPRSRKRLEKKISQPWRKLISYIGAALLALLGLQIAYCLWGVAAWIA